jgi:predicted RNA-binding protein (virulence factor B family)
MWSPTRSSGFDLHRQTIERIATLPTLNKEIEFMLEIGKTATLEVLRSVPMGLILGIPGEEVLLPSRYVPDGTSPGDAIEVFVYTDSEDRPIATTEKPLAQADEFASLKVVSVSSAGAFLDWGLPKDLLLPFRSQLQPVRTEQQVVVRVLCDSVSGRPVATTLVERFLEPPSEHLREGQAVDLLIYEETDLGYKAIIDGRFGGLLYFEPGKPGLEVGAAQAGYIQRLRTDGKIDLTLVPSGKAAIDESRETLLDELRKAGGRLELSDRSDPELIRSTLGLSKKAFKRAVGVLYRERRIRIDSASIELID